jgi:hypothetical protein
MKAGRKALGLMGAQRQQVCCPDEDFHGPVEKPTRELENPVREEMRGFHDLMRQKPPPLFI